MITARGLTKRYRGKPAVEDLSFTVRGGVVTGFLGPNGAGKSTTLRLLLGLDGGEGSATFGGSSYAELDDPLRTVGTLLDAKAAHPSRSALNHLRVIAAGAGLPERRVRHVLSQVGLDEVRDRRVGAFSLGMRQRLGLATALLGDPEYLILDEPANGLDPEGVHWMRQFLRELAAEGRVIFTSSHLLSEMSMLAEDLVVIDRGKLVATQSVREFVDAHTRVEVVVRTPQVAEFEARLGEAGARSRREETDVVVVEGVDSDEVGALAERGNVHVRELHTRRSSLEDAFLAATSGEHTAMTGGAAA